MSWYQGRHALVTGGGSGIGAAIGEALVGAGATVTLLGRNETKLAAKAKQLDVGYVVADVTDRQQLPNALQSAREQSGDIGILINNAGAVDAVPFSKMDDDYWDSTLAVNLTGVYNCTKSVIGQMLDLGSGRIVNIASTAALKGYAYVTAYCAAKHGVVGLTRALALEYARKGITVNAVCPGYTDTEIIRNAIDKIVAATGRTADEALKELTQSNPQGRLVQPDEVASTVLWLCKQESINGQAIAVAGGEVM